MYEEHRPPESLAGLVELFWVFSGDDEGVHRIAPDGRCELLVHVLQPYRELSGHRWTRQPDALFAGQLTRPLHLQGSGTMITLSARIAPGAAAAFLDGDASLATNRRVPLSQIDPRSSSFVEGLRKEESKSRQLKMFADYLAVRFASSNLEIDNRVSLTLAELERPEPIAIGGIAALIGISVRQLERLFRRQVGIPASTYSSIIRFRRVFDLLADPKMSWSAAAAEAGYSDQPQLAREFQRFLGCSATQFLRERAQLAAAMTRSRGLAPEAFQQKAPGVNSPQ